MLDQWSNMTLAPADKAGGASNGAGAGQTLNPNAPAGSPFQYAAPEGSAKTMSAGLRDIVWLMSQSPIHKSHLISDLEWPAAQAANENEPMTPVILKQFRLFYDTGPDAGGHPKGQQGGKPIGVVFWGRVSEEVEQRLSQGTSKLRPQDWTSGDRLWVVETIAPFGGAEEMVKDLKAAVFPDREIRMMVVKDGVRDVRAV